MTDALRAPHGPGRTRSLAPRAVSHATGTTLRAGTPGSPGPGRLAGLLLVLVAGSACGEAPTVSETSAAPTASTVSALQEAEAAAVPGPTQEQDLAELELAFTPLDPTLTSDKHDTWLMRQRETHERLREAGPAFGLRCLEAFQAIIDTPGSLRSAYLDVAAYCAPATCAPVLESLIVTYHGGELLRVRTEAVRLLADTSPERALEFLAPLALDERPNNTRPSQEAMMDGWARAARTLGQDEARVPAEVATNLFQPPEARYVAIRFLGRSGTPLARSALRELFVEATSDGLIRRKAAQGLLECMEPTELCPILVQVSEHESDQHFLNFLGDMIERNCGG